MSLLGPSGTIGIEINIVPNATAATTRKMILRIRNSFRCCQSTTEMHKINQKRIKDATITSCFLLMSYVRTEKEKRKKNLHNEN